MWKGVFLLTLGDKTREEVVVVITTVTAADGYMALSSKPVTKCLHTPYLL